MSERFSALNEEPARGQDEGPPGASGPNQPASQPPSRTRRLFSGWSANLFQVVLGVTQQVALVPVFLHYWTSDILAAWLAIYAAGNLVLIADAGLQLRAINRFLGFKSSADCDGRTARFYAAVLRIYFGWAGLLLALVLVITRFVSFSVVLGFQAVPNFDAAFVVMMAGVLLSLPANLVSGLYRARGLYGRAVGLQNWAMLLAQLGQLVMIVMTGSLLAVTVAYAAAPVLMMLYFVGVDAPRMIAPLRGVRAKYSWSWIIGQFRKAIPFAVAGAADLALLNLPVLLVSAFVSDRVAVAQWGLTRVAAGLVRTLCVQVTLPLAAELGHDYAIGSKDRLRNLYARGSVLITLLASAVVSGLLPFWPDFFALWTHGAVRYDPMLTITLLIGASAAAPSILASSYANYSNRGELLVRTKGLQLAVFLVLSVVLIPPLGPLGAAVAVVASDLLIQFGLLGLIIIRQTLERPLRHVVFLAALWVLVTSAGWALGTIIRSEAPGAGLLRFACECVLWLIVVAVAASPLVNAGVRARLDARIPK
jgi:O-antigen/teichoic acid export membrane protein